MKQATPGPWSWEFSGTAGTIMLIAPDSPPERYLVMNEYAIEEEGWTPNQRLIAAAPDMDLLLRAIRAGAASFYQTTGELRFGGLMYSTFTGGWSDLLNAVGRERVEAAIAAAKGETK